jgi:hypothetical protein
VQAPFHVASQRVQPEVTEGIEERRALQDGKRGDVHGQAVLLDPKVAHVERTQPLQPACLSGTSSLDLLVVHSRTLIPSHPSPETIACHLDTTSHRSERLSEPDREPTPAFEIGYPLAGTPGEGATPPRAREAVGYSFEQAGMTEIVSVTTVQNVGAQAV